MRRFGPLYLALALATGCDDLSAFRGEFKLAIVKGNFVRSCFAATTEATVSFDPAYATGDVEIDAGGAPNWLTTNDGTFNHTRLEPVRKLADDYLSQFDFPGPQRLRNYIMLARPDSGPLADRDVFVVVSLLDEKKVEVRVIGRTGDSTQPCAIDSDADAGAQDAGPAVGTVGPREYFGIFRPWKK
ncbi:MAG: hypothetical protein QM778_13690 [Myxococcales bacterium]